MSEDEAAENRLKRDLAVHGAVPRPLPGSLQQGATVHFTGTSCVAMDEGTGRADADEDTDEDTGADRDKEYQVLYGSPGLVQYACAFPNDPLRPGLYIAVLFAGNVTVSMCRVHEVRCSAPPSQHTRVEHGS